MITPRRLARALREPGKAARLAMQALLFRRLIIHPLARAVGPAVMARLAALALDGHGHAPARQSVLVLDRLYFEKDVDILRAKGTLNYVTLHTHILSVTQEAWLSPEAQVQVDYVLATDDPGWAACEAYARAIIKAAQARFGIRAVLASNVDYWQHEGFRRACAAINMPFLVLNQELQTVPSVYRASLEMYARTAFRFTGTACAVFGKATADMLIESTACRADQVAITGAPRLDPWLDGSIGEAQQDTITLLAFDGDQYFAPGCYLDTLFAFADASNHAPHLRFVLKAKDAEDEARAHEHLKGRAHRLAITHQEPLTALFPRSRLVIGYLSIAVMEALFSHAAIAVPFWGDAHKPADELNLDPDHSETGRLISFLPDAPALAAMIAQAAQTTQPRVDREAREALIFRYFHRPGEGGATAEVERFIRRYLETKPMDLAT